jgi:hypothetical protein
MTAIVRRGDCTIGLALAVLLACAPAEADEGEAAAQFDYGLREMMAGRYPTGCAALEGSFHLDPRPGTLFTLAECELQWGRTASALAGYEEYLALYSRMSPDQKTKQAERARVATEERTRLEVSVPRIAVQLPDGSPPGVVVERDDVVLGGPMLGAAIPVNPGDHIVRARMPDGRTSEQKVTADAGTSRRVVATLPGPVPEPTRAPAATTAIAEPAPPLAAPPAHASHRAWTFIALGVGAAGVAVAAGTGAVALAKTSTVGAECNAQGRCTSQTGVDAGNAARGLANVETVALVVAGAALAASLVLALTEPKGARPKVGVGIRGSEPWIGASW